jgi:hypothetical protein
MNNITSKMSCTSANEPSHFSTQIHGVRPVTILLSGQPTAITGYREV